MRFASYAYDCNAGTAINQTANLVRCYLEMMLPSTPLQQGLALKVLFVRKAQVFSTIVYTISWHSLLKESCC